MDPVVEFIASLGYPRSIANAKPRKKIELLASHYGISSKIPYLNKNDAKQFLSEFRYLPEKNKNTFQTLYYRFLNDWLSRNQMDGGSSRTEHEIVICNLPAEKFYASREWREIRYRVLQYWGNKCMACGRTPKKHGISVHVDHILPRSIYSEYALDYNNLQVLCEDCNLGKSNNFDRNWKKHR